MELESYKVKTDLKELRERFELEQQTTAALRKKQSDTMVAYTQIETELNKLKFESEYF